MAVKLEQGWSRAAAFAYTSTAFPMLTGTLVTVSGFLPIALAKSSTGEYTRSIFEVSAIALIVSWFAAVVLVPLLGYHMLPEQAHRDGHAHGDEVYGLLPPAVRVDLGLHRASLGGARRHRRAVRDRDGRVHARAAAVFPEFGAARTARRHALAGRRLVRGHPARGKTARKGARRSTEIDHVVDFVGTGAPRFYLPLDQQLQQPNFAQFVITAKDVETRDRLSHWLESTLASRFPTVRTRVARLENGPPVGFPIVPGQWRRHRRRPRHRGKSGGQGARRPHAQRAVRLGRAGRAVGLVRDRPAQGTPARRDVGRRVGLSR